MYIQSHYKFRVNKKELENIKKQFEYYRHEDHSSSFGLVIYSCRPTHFINFNIKEIDVNSVITGRFVLIKSIRRKNFYSVELIKVGDFDGK